MTAYPVRSRPNPSDFPRYHPIPSPGLPPQARELTMHEVTIYTDGACKGNPGPGGWGAWLVSGAHDKELWGGQPQTTNNRMELTAVIEALAALKSRSSVDLHLDSEYVRQGITSWIHNWKRRSWRTADGKPVKNEDLWRRLDDLAQAHQVRWHWVKGHNGHPGNERADALANRGVASLRERDTVR